jgi:Prokaryotic E2 family E
VSLPAIDTGYLRDRVFQHSVIVDGGMICVVMRGFPLPNGFNRGTSDLLLRLSPGYPDVAPDMWWFDPPVALANGKIIPATEVRESYLGRTWQRWSRHFAAGQWRSGVDTLETFLALIHRELRREAGVSGQ